MLEVSATADFLVNYSSSSSSALLNRKIPIVKKALHQQGRAKGAKLPQNIVAGHTLAQCKSSFTELHPCPSPQPSLFSKHKSISL